MSTSLTTTQVLSAERSFTVTTEPGTNGSSNGQVNFWAERWSQGRIGFHRKEVNPILIKYLDKLTDGEVKRFYVPLCGKSVDMAFLYAKGHHVFGVEAVVKAIEEFQAENELKLVHNAEDSTYETPDGRLKIFCGDVFQCPFFGKFGPFDCVWDRGSFIALEYDLRGEYKRMIQSALSVKEGNNDKSYHEFRYLLAAISYDRSLFPGPPRAVDEKDMEEYYGDWCNWEEILRETDPEDGVVKKLVGEKVESVVYFLTPKQ